MPISLTKRGYKMAKKRPLNEIMKEKREEEKAKVALENPLPTQDTRKGLPASRQGKKPVTAWIPPEAHQSLRIIAAIEGTSQEQIFKDALNDKLRQHNMPAIA